MSEVPSVEDMMSAYAQDAVGYAQGTFDVSLDYSEGSVQQVEELLTKLYETMPKGGMGKLLKKGPTPQQLDQMAKMFGGYVGEVMRRTWGGRWKLESAGFPGQHVITLEIKDGGDIWPQIKVGKRLVNGPEDNIWVYFQTLKQKYRKQS